MKAEFSRDSGADKLISSLIEATFTADHGGDQYLGVDIPARRPNDSPMTEPTRPEIDARFKENEAKIAAAEARVDARLANFDASIKSGFSDIRAEFANLRSDFSKMQSEMHKNTTDIIKWGAGIALTAVGLTVGLLTYSNNASKTPTSAVAPAPIIITVPQPANAPDPGQTKHSVAKPN